MQYASVKSGLYQGHRYERRRVVRLFGLINASFALIVLLAWSSISEFMADPLATATNSALSKSVTPAMFSYPFVLIWALPVIATIGAYMAWQFHLTKLSRFLALYPMLLFVTCIAWFHFWRMFLPA